MSSPDINSKGVAMAGQGPQAIELAGSPSASRPGTPAPRGVAQARSLFDPEILRHALVDAFKKLDPRVQLKNPVMFVVLVGTVVTLVYSMATPTLFDWSITAWLFLTVIFANFAEAMAEGRGKAQAETLRKMRSETEARRLLPEGRQERVPASALVKGDCVVCEAGDIVPSDGEITEGIASVDESAITGESAPVIRESGGDRSAVTGGTKVLSDRIVVRITAERGHTFLDRMINLVEGANRQRTPNEIALTILLAVLTIVFLPVVVVLQPFGHYSALATQSSGGTVSVVILVSLLVCLIPTTIGALLSAIGIAGMDRLVQRNVLAMSGRAVEAAGDVQTLLLDKTGTITLGNRMASAFLPVQGVTEEGLAAAAQLASLADETPEGRSIVVLAKERFGIRERDLGEGHTFVPFSATTRMSGLDMVGQRIRKGAAESVKRWVTEQGGAVPSDVDPIVERVSRSGGTPLVVADGSKILGVIELKDVIKQGIREKFDQMRQMGIRTVMITGDNPLTAAAIAQEAGVDDYLA
ncbi:MAG TPA: potassium-transporting ATPase subunit KdpB, partial [Acidimicrobiales bacterium]|nr:potassium-transporting ATPase subunit KdpB [Acidimicrobiales bacterium]